tara:strand:+ start:125 stop:1432 length:1308 start_codon:yes stop_codon:yes gene_type:complete
MTEKNNKTTIHGWAMYDWAKSGYETTVLGVFLAPFFINVVVGEGNKLNFFGRDFTGGEVFAFASSFAIFIFFLLYPTIGAIADYSGKRMRYFKIFAYSGGFMVLTYYFVSTGDVFLTLLIYFLAQLFAVGSNVFYDSVLKDITTEDTIDAVSAKGYGLGYLGGALQLILSIAVWMGLGQTELATKLAMMLAGVWWIIWSYYSLKKIKVTEISGSPISGGYFRYGWKRNINTLRKIRKYPQMLTFLIAYIFYWDGSQTVITQAANFFTEVLKLDQTSIIIIFLVVQFVAFFGAILASKLSLRIGVKNTIIFTTLLFFIAGNAAAVEQIIPENSLIPVVILGVVVGLGMGGLQSMSRSAYASMLPEGSEGEFMGFFSVISKFSAMWGPFIYGAVSNATGNARLSLPAISIFFLIGIFLLRKVDFDKAKISKEEWNAS